MAKSADIGSKRLISLAPDAWAQWVTQRTDVVVKDILASEFQWIGRETDVLMRAYSPDEGDFLVLNELQLRYNNDMPFRVLVYAALSEHRYRLPVYPVLINILPPSPNVEIVERYERHFMGLYARRDYRVINLWEVDAEIAFREPLQSLLPFVPVLRGGNDREVVQQALTMLRADERLVELETLLAFFARFVFDSHLVQQIMRWDMVVLEQSPWYQEILNRGIDQAERKMLQRILVQRFGEVPPVIAAHIETLTIEQVDTLVDMALAAETLEKFLSELPSNGDNGPTDS